MTVSPHTVRRRTAWAGTQEPHLFKGDEAPEEELDADAQRATAVAKWSQQIEEMYVIHVATRAACAKPWSRCRRIACDGPAQILRNATEPGRIF